MSGNDLIMLETIYFSFVILETIYYLHCKLKNKNMTSFCIMTSY